MGLVRKLWGGLILVIILISLATSFGLYLAGTHQSCSSASGPATSIASTNSRSGPPPLAPLPAAADLVLTPLDNLTLTPPPGSNSTAIADLTDPAYWEEVRTSELTTYEKIVPQTVIGFFNSSEEWRAWALQNLPDAPSWLDTGFVAQAQSQVSALDPGSSGSNESAPAVERGVNDFAASAAGVTLASLDFISFNGLTATKTLFETDNPTLAACQTLPGQLAQLYESSFDSSVPQADRADYLGRALAITSVMLLVGGAGGFADHFQVGLEDVGLGDAWSTVKPYLGDIGAKASAGASSATLAVLQTLAERFPQDSTFVTGFTADRVDSMVDVLEKKGISNDVIQSDIGQVAQAAGSSSDETGAGDQADALSLQQGGGIKATVEDDGSLIRYDDGSGEKATFDGLLLQDILPGFDPRGPEFVAIHCEEAGVTIYRYYDAKNIPVGGPYGAAETNWYVSLPADVASPSTTITVSFQLLTTDSFLSSIPAIVYENSGESLWVADFSQIKSFGLMGDNVQMNVEQESFEGVSSFSILGTPVPLGYSNGDTFLEVSIPNAVYQPRMLKITFDGYGEPLLAIGSGSNFSPVSLVSSDGVRLKFVSDSGGSAITISTIYQQDPSILYTPASMAPTDAYSIPGASQVYQISQVIINRQLEQSILRSDSKYDIGIVGTEIAYTVGEKNLGLTGIQIPPVSQGGADLFTQDGTVVMQARMLANPLSLGDNLQAVLSAQLQSMVDKLNTDFQYHPGATTGYAVLSYVDPTTGVVKALIAEVEKP